MTNQFTIMVVGDNDPPVYFISFAYDLADNLTNFLVQIPNFDFQVSNYNFQTSYTYDKLNRLTNIESPFLKGGSGDLVSAAYSYNQNNKLASYTPKYNNSTIAGVNYWFCVKMSEQVAKVVKTEKYLQNLLECIQ